MAFCSIEPGAEPRSDDAQRDMLLLPLGTAPAVLASLSPALLHVVAPELGCLSAYGLLEHRIVLSLTGSDPAHTCTAEQLEEIHHLIDHGRLALVPESEASREVLDRKDVKSHPVIYPVVELPPEAAEPAGRADRPFTLGFASSPFFAEHWGPRGIPLLLAVAERAPETTFVLAWRGDGQDIEREIAQRGLGNVRVRAGAIDMESFYRDVDAVVLPFGESWGCHTSPLSGIEGLLRGKPVLATERVGIAGWLARENAGVVTAASADALHAGLHQLQARHATLSEQARRSARRQFDPEVSLAAYARLYAEMIEKTPGPGLGTWRDAVRRRGGHLVKGRTAVAQYYTERAVAARYVEERFVTHPWNLLDEAERLAVSHLIEARFPGRADLDVLDIATGEGRLLRVITRYGSATALDNSPAMLELARRRADARVRYVIGDAFESPLRGRFHVITCGRFLRHLEYPERRQAYQVFSAQLGDDGIAILDFPNRAAEVPVRDFFGWERYPVYDVFWTLDEIEDELEMNGFSMVDAVPIGRGIQVHEGQRVTGEPYYHVVAFQRAPSTAGPRPSVTPGQVQSPRKGRD